jgi:hypothetical protein
MTALSLSIDVISTAICKHFFGINHMPNRHCIRMDTRLVLVPVPRKLAVASFLCLVYIHNMGRVIFVKEFGDDQATRRLSQSSIDLGRRHG